MATALTMPTASESKRNYSCVWGWGQGGGGGASYGCLLQHLCFPLPPRTEVQDGLAALGRRASPPRHATQPLRPRVRMQENSFPHPTSCQRSNTLLENTPRLYAHLPTTAQKPMQRVREDLSSQPAPG